jgi:hypothetical protein
LPIDQMESALFCLRNGQIVCYNFKQETLGGYLFQRVKAR